MSDQWYHQAFGQEFGPFSEEDLARMLANGELTADDPVRDGADGAWVPASSVSSLMQLASVAAVDAAEVATDIDSFMLVEERPSAVMSPQSKGQVSPPVAPLASRMPPASPAEWYFQTFGETHGPITLEALEEMVQRGELRRSDAIRKGTAGEWIVAGDNPVLFPFDRATPVPQSVTPAHRFQTPSGAAQPVARSTPPPTRPVSPTSRPQPTASLADELDRDEEEREFRVSAQASNPAPPPASRDADVNWYCYVNDQELGPMGTAELQGLAASGHVTAQVYVKYGPQGEWVLASQVPNLLTEPSMAPPVPEPTAADEYIPPEYMESPSKVANRQQAKGTPARDKANEADSERNELVHQLLALLKKEGLSNELMDTINISKPPKTSAGWYCNISGTVMGPVTIEALVQMVLKKRIFPDDLIRMGTSGEWFPARTVPDLFPHEAGKGKKGLDDGQNVMDRIDKMYQEAQEAKAKAEQERKSTPVKAETAPAAAIQKNAADDALRNLSANIARTGTTPASRSSGGGGSKPFLPDINFDPKILGAVAVVGLLVAGYFFMPNVLGDSVASRGFDQLMAINAKLANAREGELEPNAWKTTSAPMLEEISKISKGLGEVKPGTPRRDVSRMAGYLKAMVENAATKPAPGSADEYERNSKLFDDYTRAAMKKLGKK